MTSSSHVELRSLAVRLATLFGDEKVIADLRSIVLDRQTPAKQRRETLLSLLKIEGVLGGLSLPTLHRLLERPSELRHEVIQVLMLCNDRSTVDQPPALYANLSTTERKAAMRVLSSRRDFASRLLSEIEQGTIPQNDVSAYALRRKP